MSKNANVEKEAITPELREKADIIKKQLQLDASTGVVTSTEMTFEQTLPEGLSMKQVQKAVHAITDYGMASRIAFSEVALDGFKENPELGKVSAKIQLGKGLGITYGHTMDRHKSGVKPGTNESWEKYGDGRTTLEINALSNGRGTMKGINTYFSEEAAKALSGKKK